MTLSGFTPTLLIVDDTEPEDFELPTLKESGFILVEITHIYPPEERPHSWSRFEHEEIACGGSAFWIQEGEGLDHWVSSVWPDDITEPGWWIFTGITGDFTPGDGWTSDDDVDWHYDEIRKATQQEIDTLDWIKEEECSPSPA